MTQIILIVLMSASLVVAQERTKHTIAEVKSRQSPRLLPNNACSRFASSSVICRRTSRVSSKTNARRSCS